MEFATKEVEVASSTGVEVLAPPAGAGAGAGEGAGASGTEKESFSSQFWVSFSEQQAAILASLSPSATSDSVAAAKLQISELQSFVTAAAIDLPKYDLRRSSEEIDKLRKSVSSIEASVQPKKKFSFSSRNKAKAKNTAGTEKVEVNEKMVDEEKKKETMAPAVTPIELKSDQLLCTAKSICIEDRTDNPHIDITAEVERDIGYQVYLKNCTNCTVSVRSPMGSARLENLTNCRVYLGPCCTSTYVENCTDCIFFIRCHQLRIHHAYSSSFYVLVNSHPIIEDCSGLWFAPYSATYPTLQRDVEVANLTTARNWDNVVDFRWHRSTASPNWSVTPEEQRVACIEAKGWDIVADTTSSGGMDEGEDDEL